MRFIVASLFPLFLAGHAWSQTFKTAPQSEAKFFAKARPSMLNINGHGAKLRGILEIKGAAAKGKFEVDTNSFTTDMSLRDSHLKDKVLKPKEFPKSTLVLESVKLPAGWKPGQDLSTQFTGQMTMVGKTKPVNGDVKVSGPNMKSEVTFKIKVSDFGITPPSYMAMKVMDEVTVTAVIPGFSAGK